MNTPWPKFSTSISPKTSVRPEAMMKMIIPIARPATVSVTQVGTLPISGSAASASSATSAYGSGSRVLIGVLPATNRTSASSLVYAQRKPEQALLQRFVGGERRHRPAMHDASVLHDGDGVAELARKREVLLDEQD